MKVKVTTLQGTTFDFDAPADFDFNGFVMSLRFLQHWMMVPPGIFVPYHAISSVVIMDHPEVSAKPVMQGTMQ